MDFICISCGHVNQNEELICEDCNTPVDIVFYEKLRDYASRAVLYGYKYRVDYEEQVAKNGEVQIYYSLLQPNNLYEWLAMASISGIIGTYASSIVKHIAQQIINMFKNKIEDGSLSSDEKTFINFLSDKAQLNRFIIYVNNYYQGMPGVNKKVEKAIIEEEFAHIASRELQEDFVEALKKFDPKDPSTFDEGVFMKIARLAGEKRREKPSLEETKALFKTLKKALKKQKKSRKKKK